jgi:hypothetical protein
MSITWLGFAVIILGGIGLAVAFMTREKSKLVDPNLDDLIKVSKRLSKEQLDAVREKAESYVD